MEKLNRRKKKRKTRTIYIERKETKKLREIYLFDDISPSTVKDVIERLLELQSKSKKPITIYLNSTGGYCSAGWALIDVIQFSKCKINMVALGEVCSMAAIIFISGTKGYRYIAPHSFIMFHPMTTGAYDYVSFAKSRLRNAELLEYITDKYILRNTKIPRKVYERAKKEELWISAPEALKYRIADQVWKG